MTSTAASEACASLTRARGPASPFILLGSSALLFAISVTMTIVECASMAAMGTMPMPGGWTMSMVWMRMPGQPWVVAWASFLLMWEIMMVAMMLPSLVPTLWRYRNDIVEAGATHVERLTTIAGAAYFIVWALVGGLVFPVGAALSALVMQHPTLARGVPVVVTLLVLIAAVLQFTPWKARLRACCLEAAAGIPPANAGAAWRDGFRLGLACCRCCANLMAIQLVVGVMDLGVMALVTIAITVERLTSEVRCGGRL